MTDQCCGMDKENCCMNDKPINNQPGQPQQTYTVWERQCDNEQQLDCPVSVMKKCYPIRVPNCRTVTDIKRRTFQVSHLKLILGGPGGSGGAGGPGGSGGPGGLAGPVDS